MTVTLDDGSDEAAAFAVIRGVYESFAAGRPDDIEAVQLPEYAVWDALTPGLRQSRDDVKKFHADDQDAKMERGSHTFSIEPLKVDILGDVAVVLSKVAFSYEPPNPMSATLRVTDVLRRINGRWMMFHHHESVEPTPSL